MGTEKRTNRHFELFHLCPRVRAASPSSGGALGSQREGKFILAGLNLFQPGAKPNETVRVRKTRRPLFGNRASCLQRQRQEQGQTERDIATCGSSRDARPGAGGRRDNKWYLPIKPASFYHSLNIPVKSSRQDISQVAFPTYARN